METTIYTIEPNEWELLGDELYYFDDDLNLAIRIREEKQKCKASPFEKINILGEYTEEERDSLWWYDLTSPKYKCAPWVNALCKWEISNMTEGIEYTIEDYEEWLGDIVIPGWFIETCESFNAELERSYMDVLLFADFCAETKFDDIHALHGAIWSWYAKKYINGSQYSDGADDMLSMGLKYGIFEEVGGEYLVNRQ